MLRVTSVVGTRPNFVKIAPLCRQFAQLSARVENELVHTGQHYDYQMNGAFFQELGIPTPAHFLDVGSASHTRQTAEIMLRLEPILTERRPDWLVVVGDVNSTLAAALTGVKMGVKVAHVEAGLRSFDRAMPEEINRVITDSVADLLFAPSADGVANLLREGRPASAIHMVGNIMIDSLCHHLDGIRAAHAYRKLDLKPQTYLFCTLHRPSNVDDGQRLERILAKLRELAARFPVVVSLHPRTLARLEQFGLQKLASDGDLHCVPPLPYTECLSLILHSAGVVTDSGGIQEETTYLKVPCVTLRDHTERPVTLNSGTNQLAGPENLEQALDQAMAERGRGRIPDKWDGRTAERIASVLLGS